jgi:CubicO group peptidase (beta-lactamase class C family)
VSEEIPIAGSVAPGFEAVREEFQRNFAERGERGAACAVYHQGRKVVDLWGGYRDPGRLTRWEEDTLAVVFSTTKGMAAMAMALAHSRGLFNLDEAVARYWPEFAQAGKASITVRQLLAHQAGLAAVDETIDARKMADLDLMARILARQKPAWAPGTRHGYHGLSVGWYQNELIRRVDRERRSLGRFFAEEIARPLGIEFYIGVPADLPQDRIAQLSMFRAWEVVPHLHRLRVPPAMIAGLLWPWSLTYRALRNPRMASPLEIASPEYRTVEFPSASGTGTARAIARAYGELASGGRELGFSGETRREIEAPAKSARDAVLKIDTAYSFGFMKPCALFPYGTGPQAFGFPGAGGSVGFADPATRIGFAYVKGKLGFDFIDDRRGRALRLACYRALR